MMRPFYVCRECGRTIERDDVLHYVRVHHERLQKRHPDRKPCDLVIRGPALLPRRHTGECEFITMVRGSPNDLVAKSLETGSFVVMGCRICGALMS